MNNPESIYNSYKNRIDLLYKTYSYIDLSYDEYKKEVLKIISNNSFDNETYYDSLKSKIKEMLNIHVRNNLNDSEKAIQLLDNYLNLKTKLTIDYEEARVYYKNFLSFINNNSYNLNPEVLRTLVNNNENLQNIIKVLFSTKINQYTSSDFENITNKYELILLSEYCNLLNNEKELTINKSKNKDTKDVNYERYYTSEIENIPLLTEEEEIELMKKIKSGDELAKREFIERNLRLVMSVARNYTGNGLSFMDLVQDGNIGLIKSIDKFDLNKGCKFSTYAVIWIKESIRRGIVNKGRNIRIPAYKMDSYYKYKKAAAILEEKLGRLPNNEELAQELNIPLEKVDELRLLEIDTISTNIYVGEDNSGDELENFIPDIKTNTEKEAITNLNKGKVIEFIKSCNLTEREIEILLLRNEDEKSLEEIGKKYGLTRERIRQIEASALKKIRLSKQAYDLADLTDSPEEARDRIKVFISLYNHRFRDHKAFLKEDVLTKKRKTKF